MHTTGARQIGAASIDLSDAGHEMSSMAEEERQTPASLQVDTTNTNDAAIREEDDGHFEISIVQKMMSALVGSVLTSLLVTPLDVVRVRLQSQHRPSPAADVSRFAAHSAPQSFTNLPPNLGVTACCKEVFWVNNNAQFCVAAEAPVAAMSASTASGAVECAVEETQKRTINSTMDGLRKIARNEGLGTLWRGLSPTLVMAVPANVIYFAGYDWMRTSKISPLSTHVSDAYAPLVAGSFARVLAALAVSPIELFRTRMQASQAPSAAGTFHETLAGVREMVAERGYRSLWRGLTLTLWRDVPFSALYWWSYEATRNKLTDSRDRARGLAVDESASLLQPRHAARGRQSHTSTLIDSFIAGGISGALASIVTTPFDVGKTRQQVLQHERGSSTKSSSVGSKALRPEELSMPRFMYHIFKEEGIRGLFVGGFPRTLKVAPACAIMISSYEVGKKIAATNREEQ